MTKIIVGILVGVALVIVAITIVRGNKNKAKNNVISIAQAKKLKSSKMSHSSKSSNPSMSSKASSASQKCSNCKQPAAKLTFYATNDGRVIGVCRACKPAVERQGLLPILTDRLASRIWYTITVYNSNLRDRELDPEIWV